MSAQLRPALVALAVLSLVTGVAYPLAVTLVAQVVFHDQAEGSLIRVEDRLIGSALIGQSFRKPEYFWGRPSATGAIPYDASSSAGSNLGPTNPKLKEQVAARLKALRDSGVSAEFVPVDLVTSSGSGLDPHVSPAAAEVQVSRIASARKLPEDTVRKLVREATEGRQFGLLGEPRVNVLKLNLALDRTGNVGE
jgi:K+-transporting ATPase ATPase C chain